MNFISIKAPFSHEIDIKKSRFICYLYPINSMEEASDYIASLKKEHYKANHHCSALVIGEKSTIQKMSDDGEPSGTAGVPMLEVLKKYPVTNILAVVVRYFGGTKLGAGGLVRAYSQSVREALKNAPLVQNISQMLLSVTLSYSQIDKFQYMLDTSNIDTTMMDTQYTENVHYTLAVTLTDLQALTTLITETFHAQIDILELGEQTVDIAYTRHRSDNE